MIATATSRSLNFTTCCRPRSRARPRTRSRDQPDYALGTALSNSFPIVKAARRQRLRRQCYTSQVEDRSATANIPPKANRKWILAVPLSQPQAIERMFCRPNLRARREALVGHCHGALGLRRSRWPGSPTLVGVDPPGRDDRGLPSPIRNTRRWRRPDRDAAGAALRADAGHCRGHSRLGDGGRRPSQRANFGTRADGIGAWLRPALPHAGIGARASDRLAAKSERWVRGAPCCFIEGSRDGSQTPNKSNG